MSRSKTMSDSLSMTFLALSNPTRREILSYLRSGDISVKDLAKPFEMSIPAIIKHLKILERAGLITRGREAQWRPSKLNATPLKEAVEWLEEYRQFWNHSFERLEGYIDELKQQEEREKNDRNTTNK